MTVKLQRRDVFRATVAGFLSKFVGTTAATKAADAAVAIATLNGRIYFNHSKMRFECSTNGGPYIPLVGPFR